MKHTFMVAVMMLGTMLLSSCAAVVDNETARTQTQFNNQAPTAQIKYSLFPINAVLDGIVNVGAAEQQVPTFNVPAKVKVWGGDSFDVDGRVTGYNWTLNGRSLSTSQNPVPFTLNEPGLYTIKLTVTDDKGASHQVQAQFHLYGQSGQPTPTPAPTPGPIPPPVNVECSELLSELSDLIEDCASHTLAVFARGVTLKSNGDWQVTVLLAAKRQLELASFLDEDQFGGRLFSGFGLNLAPGEQARFSYTIETSGVRQIVGLARVKPAGGQSDTIDLVSDL